MAGPEQDNDGVAVGPAKTANGIDGAYQGKVTGVIQPPPEIRAVVDKTARFVAKNGKSFEQRILASEEGKSAKFNFMRPHDPYYAYYEFKIREFEEGGDEAGAAKPATDGQAASDGAAPPAAGGKDATADAKSTAAVATVSAALQRKAVMAPIAKAAKSIDKDKPPPPYEFSAGHPSGLSAADVDLIKLTAQYTAAGGRAFLGSLAQREARNEQFQFLKHTHALFSYFTSLVDAYTKVLQPTATQKEAVSAARDKTKLLERAVHRWEHDRAAAEKRAADAAQADAERVAFRSIDWHDFVVVTTIDFPDDEVIPLDYNASQPEEAGAGAAAPAPAPAAAAAAAVDADGDVDMDVEMEEDEMDEAAPQPLPPPPPDEEGIRVVTDYRPAVARPQDNVQLPDTVVDPITGRVMRASELSDHMRVQLLDPKSREEQRRFLERQKDTAMAEGEAIAANLTRFARKRGDIFGTAEEEEAAAAKDAERRRQRMEETNRIMWDGLATSAQEAQEKARAAAKLHAQQPQPPPPPAGVSIGPSVPGARISPPPPPAAAAAAAAAAARAPMAPPPPPPPRSAAPAQTATAAPLPPLPPPRPPAAAAAAAAAPPPPPPPRPVAPRPAIPQQPAAAASSAGDALALDEETFAASHPGAVHVSVRCPVEADNDALRGQVVQVTVPSVRSTVRELKELLSPQLGGMPVGRQQLKEAARGFLKDQNSLASYNLGGSVALELVPRSRGARR